MLEMLISYNDSVYLEHLMSHEEEEEWGHLNTFLSKRCQLSVKLDVYMHCKFF